MTQEDFDRYLLNKYETYDNLYNGIHHYESIELKDSRGVTLLPTGTTVSKGYTYTYWDSYIESLVTTVDLASPITNFQYEEKIEDDKRNIFLLKGDYLKLAVDNMSEIMDYKKGSSNYISRTLKNADNIRLTS